MFIKAPIAPITTSARTAHALRIVLITVPCVGGFHKLFLEGFDLHLLQPPERGVRINIFFYLPMLVYLVIYGSG